MICARPPLIDVLVLPGAHLLDVAAPAQVLGHPLFGGTARPGARLRYIGPRTDARSAQGLLLGDLAPLPETIGAGAWLLVCGVSRAQDHLDDPPFAAARHWLARHARDYALRIGICSGSLLLGAAGLLDGRRCTTHHDVIAELGRIAPLADVAEDCLFVDDGDCITSAGIATGLDLALHLVARTAGHAVATRIARETVLYHRRAGEDSQRSFWLEHRNHVASRMHRVQDRIMGDPGGDWTAGSLAADIGLGERQLRRVFAAVTGIGLGEYLVRARLELARQLLAETRLGMAEIAERAGFGSERSLRRHWSRRHGGPPSLARRA